MAEKYGSTKGMTVQQKLKHYWYYYKGWFFGILIVLAVVVAGVTSMLSNPQYDASFLLVTRGKDLRAGSPLVLALETAVEQYASDTDGNGEVNVLCDVIAFPVESADYANDSETAMQTRLAGELQLGDSQMFIMDTSMYEYLDHLGGFADLTKLFPDRDIPQTTAIPLSETALYDLEVPLPEGGLNPGQTLARYKEDNQKILDDLYLIFREDAGLKPERRAVQLDIFENIVNAG